nr:DUF805 domain-containing protein [Massilia antarctica]
MIRQESRVDNPYAPPASGIEPVQEHGDTYVPTWFDASGRIGRLRYLVYVTLPTTLMVVLVEFLNNRFNLDARPRVLWALTIAAGLAVAALLAVMSLRRLRDLGRPWGWALILPLAPINLLLIGVLLVRPGDQGRNRYGPPASENTMLVVAGAWVLLLTALTWLAWLFDIG